MHLAPELGASSADDGSPAPDPAEEFWEVSGFSLQRSLDGRKTWHSTSFQPNTEEHFFTSVRPDQVCVAGKDSRRVDCTMPPPRRSGAPDRRGRRGLGHLCRLGVGVAGMSKWITY